MQKKNLIRIGVALLLVAASGYWFMTRNIQSTDDAQIEAYVIPISAKVAGYVTALHITDNGAVEAGAPLLEIDPRDYQIKRDQAAAGVLSAQANAVNAAINLKRTQSISTLARSRKQLDDATEAAHMADAQLAIANAQLAQAEKDLADTKLLAPSAGMIADRGVEQGAYVQPGQVLFSLIPPERWVVANFKETQIRRMKPGQRVALHVDAYPDLDVQGKIDSMQQGTGARFSLFPPENATGNYVKIVQRVPVKITLDAPPPDGVVLGAGMSVIAHVHLDE